MKRIFLCALTCILLISAICVPCFAAEPENTEITYLEDGSYFVTTVTTSQVSRASKTITAQKSKKYYNNNDELLWECILTGTFTYNPGVSSTCTNATCDVEITDTAWSCSSKSASPSGNQAIGNAEVIKKVLFITAQTVPVSLTLTCDTNGNLS